MAKIHGFDDVVAENDNDKELSTTEPTLRNQEQERGVVELGDIDGESD